MKLKIFPRAGEKKSEIKEVRRQGDVPAVFYSKTQACEKVSVKGTELSAVVRALKPGRLPTTVFELEDGQRARRAIIKDIQYHPTTYRPLHIDFEELVEEVPVQVKVPIQCSGVMECAGVKLGGFLRQVIRYVKVECLPRHIPQEFTVDVKELGLRQSRRLKDLELPKGVKLLAPVEEVVVVIAKR